MVQPSDEVAALKAQLKRLEQHRIDQSGRAARGQELLAGRMLVLVATTGLFLAVSMGWYAEIDTDDESFESASGWDIFALLAGSTEDEHAGVLVFAGYYSWVVVLAALAAGASAMVITKRWVSVTLATLLGLLTGGHLLLNSQVSDDSDGEQLAGTWAAMALMTACAFAWGNLAPKLRDLADDSS